MTPGIWDQFTADKYHQSSPKLAAYMAQILPKNQKVIDFGCGNAFYCAELAKKGFRCMGVEGFPLNNFLHDDVLIQDLTEPFTIAVTGSVISLEVAEHIDKRYEQIFLDNITGHCNGMLIVSWALPGQPGIGHINCQPKEYVCGEVCRRGFDFLEGVTDNARKNHIDKNCDWFERTLLIFNRR